jgi:aldose 1-epimerase
MMARVRQSSFGKMPDGTAVDLYTLENTNGFLAKVTNYGTIICELHVPDRDGKSGDVVLGFDNLGQYLKGHPCFGCTVGRVANRIAKGRFALDGKTYALAVNNGPNHLHGGLEGFDKKVWKGEKLGLDNKQDLGKAKALNVTAARVASSSLDKITAEYLELEILKDPELAALRPAPPDIPIEPQPGAAVKFSYTSPDGEEGYPGTLTAAVTMTLTDDNELRLDYSATTDKPTPVNLTNHSYFNLAGHGDALRHELMIAADHYTPSDSTLIPTGEIKAVKGTPMDFTRPQAIGSRFGQLQGEPVGYDTNYVLNSGGKGLGLAARVYEPETGRVVEVHTTEPGVQLYTANFLDGSLIGKGGTVYRQHAAFCLETQHFPDAVNQPGFPSIILRPGQVYRQTTVFKFSAR